MTERIISGTMIDTETLSLGGRALPWEVAAVRFNIDIGQERPVIEIERRLLALVDYDGMSTRGFDIEAGTISWTNGARAGEAGWTCWRGLNLDGKKGLSAPADAPLMKPAALWRELDWFTGRTDPVYFRNSAFDPVVLSNFFEQAGIAGPGAELPWGRRQQCDLYSYVNLAKQLHGYEDNLPKATGHRALEDCMGQIDQLAEVLHLINPGEPRAEPAPSLEF